MSTEYSVEYLLLLYLDNLFPDSPYMSSDYFRSQSANAIRVPHQSTIMANLGSMYLENNPPAYYVPSPSQLEHWAFHHKSEFDIMNPKYFDCPTNGFSVCSTDRDKLRDDPGPS
ncbi:hypothetical protein CFAM422_001155 [Trichoderma lentiforme]|uniref:Uncharacterized protein n=1 Tax=Trichoderma lentiforme TaxID=1567552 RepID=A0A9P4XL06_9HYPO|nr:hypothetical protein CFAM422_001155 [Trichoderma lentiforme]